MNIAHGTRRISELKPSSLKFDCISQSEAFLDRHLRDPRQFQREVGRVVFRRPRDIRARHPCREVRIWSAGLAPNMPTGMAPVAALPWARSSVIATIWMAAA